MDIKFRHWDTFLVKKKYGNGRTALQLLDKNNGFPVAVATVNMPDIELEEGEVIIKDYSENQGIHKTLLDAGVIEDTYKFASSGFVTCPICKLLI